ncbi:class B secretin-like G-protein coupled receptor GPRghp2, putative [Pediculus humanus corporis]|uniref:Class B secretin-like G-protein coupled receptor GPRghp2, putative n=1 Tax=Pediculus humanus subsp. corporis TaxID=121224 RepID=E0VU51_PEDHC|nr:class B secretin-like G-protein coupled receptor GPRghp2, putative [Pediculus humanus corporis]EEB16907.1 class B secretin-like G-protein coupled receptor GPRghp2, putative [Pediculus humanus corporis]
MDNDLSTVDAIMLGEVVFPFDGSTNNSSNNFTMLMFPRRDPLYIVIPMTIIYSFIFITGVVGNVITFIVIVKNKYMHTATNYYLFSLAISDLLLLVSGLPQEMVSIWCRYPYMFGEIFCVLRGLSAETSTNASVLTITAFTVERYVAICHPFLSHTMSKLSRAVKLIIVIWLVALSFAIPQAIQFGVVIIDNDPDQAMCTLKRTIIDHSFVLSSFLFFVTPMTLITVLYVLIGIKLRKSSMMKRNGSSFYNNVDNKNNQRGKYYPPHHQSSKRVLKMLVAVVVAFFICWAPFHAQRLVYTYGSNKDNKPKGAIMKLIYEIITYVSGILYYLSTTINPILYHIMSLKFREAFKDTLARCTCTSTNSNKRGKSYLILNGYSVGTFSRRRAHSYDADNSSNFVRDDSIRSNGLSYDVTLSK